MQILSIVITPVAADAGHAAPRDSAESRIQHPFGVLNPGFSIHLEMGFEPSFKGSRADYLTIAPRQVEIVPFVKPELR